jgi:site-specific recombinase XerC
LLGEGIDDAVPEGQLDVAVALLRSSLTWGQVIKRDTGEAQLEIIGKGSKTRQVLIPAVIAAQLFESRGDAPASAPVFASVRRLGQPLTERAVN